jgi:DtxR family transcriptional regulator, Mn-dependent transcriptional regulator
VDKEVIEQYLKTILSLGEGNGVVKTTEIANALNLAPASVTESLQKLSDEGFVKYRAYKGVKLTSKGRAIASKVSRKHRLLERFLTDVLGLESSKVHKQACEMEHTLSDEAEVALCRMLNHPGTCPDDGKTIPPCNLDVSSCDECKKIELSKSQNWDDHSGLKPLTTLASGESGKIHFIRGGGKMVERLNNIGITRNTEVKMLHSAPMRGPVEISVRGCKLCLGREIASNIFIQS